MAGKQAKILSNQQIKTALKAVQSKRHPERNRVIILLSTKAGLRAGEIANLTWPMVCDADGRIGDHIELHDNPAKKGSGRTIPLHSLLKTALCRLRKRSSSDGFVISSERGNGMSPSSMSNWFSFLYRDLGLEGCSSHSGRRTFITRAARVINQTNGSLRDVQILAGHRSISMTQLYIEGDTATQRKLVELI